MSATEHPDGATLSRKTLSDEVARHLLDCAACRIERRRIRRALRTRSGPAEPLVGATLDVSCLVRTMAELVEHAEGSVTRVVVQGSDSLAQVKTAGGVVLVQRLVEPDLAAIEMRFAQLRTVQHPSLLAWSRLRHTKGAVRAEAQAPPEGTVPPAPASVHALARLAAQTGHVVAHLHRLGLPHGRVADAVLGVGPTGRVVLAPAALTQVGDLAEDRRGLGRLWLSWIERMDLPPLRALAHRLVDGELSSTERLLADLLQVLDATSSGALRYHKVSLLGRGGMGEVSRADDPLLDRQVALKELRPAARMSTARFVAEARITASLQHPGVVPVHEVGELPDGRPYYAMQVVEGQTLTVAIQALHQVSTEEAWGVTPDGLTLRRLVEVFARVCDAVGYAHSRGVVHRDLKPDNVALGEHGVVTVLDWGLASLESELPTRREIVGTPGYLSPEQARGVDVDRRTDVFALGRTLQVLLTGTLSHTATAPPAPAALEALRRRCVDKDPAARPSDASRVAAEVRRWIDGVERRALADRALEQAAPFAVQAAQREEQASRLRREAADRLAKVPPHAGVQAKLPAWGIEDRARALETESAVLRTRYEQGLRAALDHAPDHRHTLDALAQLYKQRLLVAEARRHTPEAARLTTLLEGHDGGRHRGWLNADGAVSLVTDPPGARVIVERFVERDRRLVAEVVAELGPTPLREQPLPPGSYRLRIRHPACEEVLYPVLLDRGSHWSGVAPDASEPSCVPLPARGSLKATEVYVPPGWCWVGGDDAAVDSLPRRRLWVDGFVMQRSPVTLGSYVAFLNALVKEGREAEALAAAPMESTTHKDSLHPLLARDAAGRFLVQGQADGRTLSPDEPAVLLDRVGMAAFAAWRSRGGPHWRLPHELEWEKAARGVDGRAYPWGSRLDPAFANMAASHLGAPHLTEIGGFPLDESPYGVLGLGGNVRDRCGNGYLTRLPESPRLSSWGDAHEDGTWSVSRGGAWTSVAAYCRSAARFAGQHTHRLTSVGFRLVWSKGSSRRYAC